MLATLAVLAPSTAWVQPATPAPAPQPDAAAPPVAQNPVSKGNILQVIWRESRKDIAAAGKAVGTAIGAVFGGRTKTGAPPPPATRGLVAPPPAPLSPPVSPTPTPVTPTAPIGSPVKAEAFPLFLPAAAAPYSKGDLDTLDRVAKAVAANGASRVLIVVSKDSKDPAAEELQAEAAVIRDMLRQLGVPDGLTLTMLRRPPRGTKVALFTVFIYP